MGDNFKVEDLIAILNQIKPNESSQNNINTEKITSVFSDISNTLQNNTSNQEFNNPQDIASLFANIASNLQKNNTQTAQNNQNAPNFNDILQNLMGNGNKNGANQQNNLANIFQGATPQTNDIASIISSIFGNPSTQNSQNQQQMNNLFSLAGPIFNNMQNNSMNNQRINLLSAVKPFLGDVYTPHIEHGIRLVSIARTTKSALGGISGLSAISNIK